MNYFFKKKRKIYTFDINNKRLYINMQEGHGVRVLGGFWDSGFQYFHKMTNEGSVVVICVLKKHRLTLFVERG
jgi:hypothetical protein